VASKFVVKFMDEKTGRIYIPKNVRDEEKLKPGDYIEVTVEKKILKSP